VCFKNDLMSQGILKNIIKKAFTQNCKKRNHLIGNSTKSKNENRLCDGNEKLLVNLYKVSSN